MKNIVLLVVDVQTSMIEEHPYDEKNIIENINEVLKYGI
jgi:nicotinamidase-related amidase